MDQPRTQETNHAAAKDSFGVHLRREREMRGVTLEEISSATRIGTRFLEALETEHWDRLPGGVFNRGFVRSTSQFLGLDPEAMLAEYTLATADSTRPAATPTLIHSQSSWTPRAAASQREGSALPWIVLIVIVALALGGWFGWRHYRALRSARAAQAAFAAASASSDNTPAGPAVSANSGMAATAANSGDVPADAQQAGSASPSANDSATAPSNQTTSAADSVNGSPNNLAADPASAAASGAGAAAAPASAPAAAPATIAATAGPLVLKIEAGRSTTVKVSIDGKKSFQGKIAAGGDKIFHANDVFYVTAHDAGAVLLELNGQTLPPLGPQGHSGSIRLSRETLKSQDGTSH
jgi:cytoskeleton protein RodZ